MDNGTGPAAEEPRLRVGGLVCQTPVILAPMAGYTDLPFRRLCRRFGAGLVYTELTSVDGIVRDAPRTLHCLATDPAERPVAAHLYGHDPDVFAEAAARVEAMGRFDVIDINAGCPVRKVVARGAGAGLIRNPERLRAVVAAVRRAVSIPVTVKTRIGSSPDRFNLEEIVRAVEEGGADALALHARFTSARHSGQPRWDVLAQVRSLVRIPLIGNGGVRTPEDAAAMFRETGVDGVMIGRGALGRPWVFAQVRRHFAGRPFEEPSLEERRTLIEEHLQGAVELAKAGPHQRRGRAGPPEEAAARHFRAHLIHYLAGLRGVSEMKRHLNDIHSSRDVMAAVDGVLRTHATRRCADVAPSDATDAAGVE